MERAKPNSRFLGQTAATLVERDGRLRIPAL
jgi:hypothetical protein